MNIPEITNIETALRVYYANSELGNKELTSLFGKRSSATISRLKRIVKDEMTAEMAGLKRIVIHEFRHSHVSVLANNGINIQEIARRLGHAKIEMTLGTYSHLYPQEEERAVEVLNAIE